MAASPPSRPGGGLFTDARSCKDWLGALPVTSIPMAQQHLLEAIRAFNRSELDPLERLKCLELLREKVAFLQGEQRSRFFGKTLPLSSIDQTAWTTGRSLLEEMEAGYRLCLTAAQAGERGIADHAALAAQRVMRAIGAQMLFHAMVYRRFDGGLWQRLHAEFEAAERGGLVDAQVKDSLEGEDGLSTVGEAYVNALLLQAADLAEMTAPQIDFLEAVLRRWVRKVRVAREVPAGESTGGGARVLGVDLSRPVGAFAPAGLRAAASERVLDVEQLSRSIRRRVKALQAGESVANLGLPEAAAGVDMLSQLQRMHRCWCEGGLRPPGRVPPEKEAGVVFGFPDIHFYVSGCEPFDQPDKPRELTRQEKDDIAVFGKVSERSQKLRVADYNFVVESWGVLEESLGAWRLLRPASASRGVALGRVVAVRVGASAPYFLGVVKSLVQETDGRIEITVGLLPGKPEAVAVRVADLRSRQASSWTQAFRLPPLERLGIPESFVVPGGLGSRGRGMEVWRGEAKESTVREVLERGADFDRITLG